MVGILNLLLYLYKFWGLVLKILVICEIIEMVFWFNIFGWLFFVVIIVGNGFVVGFVFKNC